jgi:hypothetical protein
VYEQEPGAYVQGPPGNIFPTFTPPPPPRGQGTHTRRTTRRAKRIRVHGVGDMVSNKKPFETTKWGWTYHDPPRDPPAPNRTSLSPVGSFPAGWQHRSEPPALSSPHRTAPKPNPNPIQTEPPRPNPNPIRIRPARTSRSGAGGRPEAVHGNLSGRGRSAPESGSTTLHPFPPASQPELASVPFASTRTRAVSVPFFAVGRLRITYMGFVLAVPDCQAVASRFLT